MSRRDRVSLALIGLTVAAAVFLVGGATRWAQAAVGFGAAAALVPSVVSRRRFDRAPLFLLFLGVGAAWTAFQCLPLPEALLNALSPALNELRSDGAEAAGVSVASTLNVEPGAGLRALSFLVTLSAVAFVSLRLSVSERGRYTLIASVGAVVGLAALVSGVHRGLGLTHLYGIYEATQAPVVLGPMLNTNHLGCLMAIGTLINTGLALYGKQRGVLRLVWIGFGAACLLVTLATLSRGAVIGLAAGGVTMLLTLLAQRLHTSQQERSRDRQHRFLITTLPVGIMVVCGLVLAVYLGANSVMQELDRTSLDEISAPRTKFAAWRSAAELVDDAPWAGIGRGAFEAAFTRVHPASAYVTFSHAENEYVQAVVEWGIPATVALAVLGAWVLLLAMRRWNATPLAAACLGALTAVLFQSNFDFGLQLLGIAVPVTVMLATLTHVPLAEMGARRRKVLSAVRVGHLLVVTLLASVLFHSSTRTLQEAHERLARNPSDELVRETIAQHPLDYFGYALLARTMLKAKHPDAISMLNHATRLHPTQRDLHWISARLFLRLGRPEQAESEYATAIRYSANPKPVLLEVATQLPAERAAQAIPLDFPINTLLAALGPLHRVTLLWLVRVLPHSFSARTADMLYSVAIRQNELVVAERALRTRCELLPSTSCEIQLAQHLARMGRHKEVVQLLRGVADWRVPERAFAWRLLCDAHQALGRAEDALDCRRRLEITVGVPTPVETPPADGDSVSPVQP